MKKTVIFMLIFSSVFLCTLSAQGKLGFGVKGGVNMAKFTGDDADMDFEGLFGSSPGFVFGPTIGGFATFNFNDKLSIRPEFMYTAKGASYDLSDNILESGISMTVDGNVDIKMNWLDIPLLVVFNLNDQINVFAGPYLALFLSGKTEMDITVSGSYGGQTYSESESDSEDIKSEDVTSPSFGLIFGGGFMLGNNLGVEARYSLGLTSIDEEVSLKDNGIQVLINFFLKK